MECKSAHSFIHQEKYQLDSILTNVVKYHSDANSCHGSITHLNNWRNSGWSVDNIKQYCQRQKLADW